MWTSVRTSVVRSTEYDAATAAWGSDWRMPTREQMKELYDNCTFAQSTVNGVNGYLFTSNANGNTLFLPGIGWCGDSGYNNLTSLGRGFYWTGALDTSKGESAYFFINYNYVNLSSYRHAGYGIRAVRSDVPNPAAITKQPEAINLGLPSGTKWASFNVGATSPEEIGEKFAWGELGEKQEYSEDTYQFCVNGSYMNIGDDISGTKYDVAHQRWGGNWRMPTQEEFDELEDNCTLEMTTYQGVQGGKFTSKKNGNSIFLPATDLLYNEVEDCLDPWGYYWSSTQKTDSSRAYYLSFASGLYVHYSYRYRFRYSGLNVRPVVGN
jgi:hypothetical protein